MFAIWYTFGFTGDSLHVEIIFKKINSEKYNHDVAAQIVLI